MITTHKKNQRTRLSQSIKRTIGLQSIRNEQTITSLSKAHECSRGTVYAQKHKALDAVNQAFEHDDGEVMYYIPATKAFIHQVVLALLLICQSSYRNIIFFLASIFDYSLSLGGVFNVIDKACDRASQINASYDLGSIKTSAADELFHRNKPNLAVVDVDSRYCALLAKADSRDYETWGIYLLDLQKQGYAPETTIMDSAKGLVKSHEEVMPNTARRHDQFHLIKDLQDCARFLKNKEASSVTQTLKLLKKSETTRDEALKQQHQLAFANALTALEELEDIRRQFNCLSNWLQFNVLQLAGHEPKTRSMLYDFITDEITALAKRHPNLFTLYKFKIRGIS